jgi:hypothetical protein
VRKGPTIKALARGIRGEKGANDRVLATRRRVRGSRTTPFLVGTFCSPLTSDLPAPFMDQTSNLRACYRILEDGVTTALRTRVGDRQRLGSVRDDVLSFGLEVEKVSKLVG